MATATSRRAPASAKAAKERRELAEERVGLERKVQPDSDRMSAIDASLKKLATEAGQSFTETFPDLGDVKVAPGYAAEFKGDLPVVQTEAWRALTPAERKAHEKSGLIKIEPQWGKASGGRVAVKLFGVRAKGSKPGVTVRL